MILVTGANGFIGRHLCAHLLSRGHAVRGGVRKIDSCPQNAGLENVPMFRCELPDAIDERAFEGVETVVHLAYTSRHTTLAEARRVNEEGSARVYELARRAGAARFVFLSTTSAHADALSYYGRSKLAIEGRLDLARDLVLRAGLVLGPDGGLFQRMTVALKRTGILPLFDGGNQPLQTVHVDDLCATLERAVSLGFSGRYVVAEPGALTLRELFQLVAAKMGRRCLAVPVPTGPLLVALRVAERLRIPLPISSENLLGARALRVQPSAEDLRRLGVELRSAEESLDRIFADAACLGSRPQL